MQKPWIALPCLWISLISAEQSAANNLQDKIIRSIVAPMIAEESQAGLRLSLAENKDMPARISYRIVPVNVQHVKDSAGLEAGLHELVVLTEGHESFRQRFIALPDLSSDLRLDYRRGSGFFLQQNIELPPLRFAKSRKEIREESLPILDYLAALLEDEQDIRRLSIDVHTDSGGQESRNRSLTQARADEVKKFLLGRGIEEGRLIARGMGSSRPLVPNTSLENRLQNRRTEYVVAVP